MSKKNSHWDQAVDDFVSFWKRFNPRKCAVRSDFRYAHDDDVRVLRSASAKQYRAENLRQFMQLKSDKATRGRLCFNVLPEPYCGDLLRAKVFILRLNPALGPANSLELRNVHIQSRWRQMIRQDFKGTKFWHLDSSDENVLHGGFVWWESRLSRTLDELV
jgi:hypothetical protein